MYERIAVPLDGSNLAELALPYAERLAGAFGSELILLLVSEPAESEHRHMQQLYIEKMADLAKSNLKGKAVTVKAVILSGESAKEIVDYAERNNISLIIMASHGRSGIMAWAIGSVGNKVLQMINMPILLVRAKTPNIEASTEKLFSRILIPLDGSELGEAALPYVQELSNKLSTEVTLLQVVAPGKHVHTIGGLNYVPFKEQILESMKTEAIQYLEKVSQKLTGTKAITKRELRIGDAAHEIIEFADETNTSLIAMSTHGYSGVKQWIMGSIAQKILQAGSKPILFVKAPGVKA